ncbi:LPXTG cell wall anchor domain-containing protein [Mesobacillus jeotgali]|uniref:LPXTG cell wall anchor domain-containing protein n=1 Tax=Mesobacillus jeotgali TaxID=129985 RepID=A0ABY9VLN2_9BACI|nr:LPXTG cell wall anchor domain-containing protein [Mesobacillus jeotgali]WNF23646.1 LPXTG cell wall anchor domain-containing protein [Mesobacillus jeotgali]
MKKFNFIFTFLVFGIFVLLLNPLYETNANKLDPIVDIDTLPRDYFIMVDRLKPGDSITSQIKVINKGTLNFNYNMWSEYVKGSKEYYDSLYLEINDRNNNNLYSGKLSEFKGLKNTRNLLIFTSEILSVKVLVPHEIGNEFQGLSTDVKLLFNAMGEEQVGSSNEHPGERLPNTSTNSFNLIAIGISLILCGLIFFIIRYRKSKITKE